LSSSMGLTERILF